MARSIGMLVNSDTASNEIKISVSEIFLPERDLYNSKLLLTWIVLEIKLSETIFCMKLIKECRAVLIEEIMILKETFNLWIFGSAYVLDKLESPEYSEKYVFLEMYSF